MSNYSESFFEENNKNSSWYKIFQLIPEKSKILDIGSSSGNFGEQLIKRKNCIVDGVELDPGDYKEAKTKLRNVYKLNIESDSLDNIGDKYDFVYFGDVIEHLVTPVPTLMRVTSLLKPGGKVLFSIPNMANVAVRLSLLKGNFDYTKTGLLDNTHLHFYSLDEVDRVFNEAGFEIDHIDFIEKDYPKPVIEEWLAGLGLKADGKFYESMRQPEAAAFQFVGSAKVAKHPKKVSRMKFGPIDLYSSYHRRTLKTLRDELTAAINHKDELIAQKDQELAMIKSSRAWKLRNKLARLMGKEPIV